MAHTLALLVTEVRAGSQGESIGLKKGDAIHRVNGVQVIDNKAFGEQLRVLQGNGVLSVERRGELLEVPFEQGPLGIVTEVLPFETEHLAADGAPDRQSLRAAARKVVVTTAPSLENYRLVKTVEVVSAECVFGINVFRDFFAGLTDVFGGRSNSVQDVLRNARRTALEELKMEAASVGANAVIATDLDYSEFTGKGTSMLFLVASGTAVIVEPVGEPA